MDKMAITPKGLKLLLVGFIVMLSGYILMTGGGSDNPEVFNYAMFDFRRLVAAPLVILIGVVIEIVAIWACSEAMERRNRLWNGLRR